MKKYVDFSILSIYKCNMQQFLVNGFDMKSKVFLMLMAASLFTPQANANTNTETGTDTEIKAVTGKETVKQSVPATVLKVVDGDTIKVSAHIWLGITVDTMVRIKGIDTPELRGKCPYEKQLAKEAKAFVKEKLPLGSTVYLSNVEYDKYGGRVVAKVADSNKKDIGKDLIKNGFARSYSGKTAKSNWCLVIEQEPKIKEIISVHKPRSAK